MMVKPNYVQTFPTNPINGLNTVRIDGDDAGANANGWRFDSDTGLLEADDLISNAAEEE